MQRYACAAPVLGTDTLNPNHTADYKGIFSVYVVYLVIYDSGWVTRVERLFDIFLSCVPPPSPDLENLWTLR